MIGKLVGVGGKTAALSATASAARATGAAVGKRQARTMLRRMQSGEPVRVAPLIATMKKLTRLAFIAQQFGYDYADIRQGGGPKGNGYLIVLVPDPAPEAVARAARNRARYPHAADGGPLPPLVPEAVELLKARMTFDIATRTTEKQMAALTGIGAVPLAVLLGLVLGSGSGAVVLGVGVWLAVMALVPVGIAVNRRYKAKCAAVLQAAGFTPVTDRDGRLRYAPPSGRLPGRGGWPAGGR